VRNVSRQRPGCAPRARACAEIADALGISLDTARRYVRAHPCDECSGPVVAGGRLCQRCTLIDRAQPVFTHERALQAMRAWAAETGEPPRFAEWQTLRLGGAEKWTAEHPRFPSANMAARLFGSWEVALRAAGFTPRRRRWTKAAVIDVLRRDAQRRGRPPFYNEWRGASDEHPDSSTAVELFSGWLAALAAAGLSR
jgi:hypothetical protein